MILSKRQTNKILCQSSFLHIAIQSTLAMSFFSQAEDITCSDVSNCPSIGPAFLGTSVLSSSINAENKSTISMTGNNLTLNWSDSRTQPDIDYVYGAYSSKVNIDASHNTVTIANGTVSGAIIAGTSDKANAIGNTVNISDGAVVKNVSAAVGGEEVRDNTVNISGGNVELIYGAYGLQALGNTVNVSDGRVGGIYGATSIEDATNNVVTISGGIIEGNIVGAVSYQGYANGNSITIMGAPSFGANTILSGGISYRLDGIHDNTLNIHSKNIAVKKIQHFEHINFYLNEDVKNGETLLTLSGGTETDLSTAMIKVGVESTNGHLQKGHKVKLITTNGTLKYSTNNASGQVVGEPITAMSGISTLFDFEVSADTSEKQLVAELTDSPNIPAPAFTLTTSESEPVNPSLTSLNSELVNANPTPLKPEPIKPLQPSPKAPNEWIAGRINPQTKALLESGLAAANFIGRGNDLAQNSGLKALQTSADNEQSLFVAVGAHRHRTDTGSHIKVKGISGLLGIGKKIDNTTGNLKVAAFSEIGDANYDAYNDIVGMDDVYSNGGTSYYGIGIMAEQQLNHGLSLNTGLHFGRTETDFNSSTLTSASGQGTQFESKRNYIAAFAGADYDFPINDSSKINLNGNFKYAHIDDDKQIIAGDTFNFDKLTSLRITIGASVSRKINVNSEVYAGFAWEHEFKGTGSATVNHLALPEPSLKGDTSILEVGYRFTPESNDHLHFGLSAVGTVGKRQGASAQASLKYDF